jgi:hypothetical protein
VLSLLASGGGGEVGGGGGGGGVFNSNGLIEGGISAFLTLIAEQGLGGTHC